MIITRLREAFKYYLADFRVIQVAQVAQVIQVVQVG